MYLGIDLGTSGIKVVLMNQAGKVVDSATSLLSVQRPEPLFSEQNPQDWWNGLDNAMQTLKKQNDLLSVESIGLSGQMHGAVILDKSDKVLHPAILWNDNRSEGQCKEIEAIVGSSRVITGNIAMPGFTAPKLLWLKQHKPEVFSKIEKVLLPKDYLRLLLSGDYATDMSDSAGTLWLNTASRTWDHSMLSACGLNVSQMPSLYEGTDITGYLKPTLSLKWGLAGKVPIVAGGGDNAAGAIGAGVVHPGQGMLSLGTSGVYFVVSDSYSAQTESAVHSFCHALPQRWHLMSVLLSAASCLQWFAKSIVEQDISDLMHDLEKANIESESPYFLPYLSGERTPHNNPHAKGAFFGLTHSSAKLSMLHSVLEGVSFAFADGVDALHASGTIAKDITLIGGGTKSEYWRQMLADILGVSLKYRESSDVGPALGAARLAQLAVDKSSSVECICSQPDVVKEYRPNVAKIDYYKARRAKFQQLYKSTKHIF